MTQNEIDKVRHDIANGMLGLNDLLGPIFDAADGVKADMEKRGWSPTACERVALVWLTNTLSKALQG